MNRTRNWISKHSKIFLFLIIIFIFGLCSGILFYFKQSDSLINTLITNLNSLFSNNVFDIKNIFYHFIILLLIGIFLFTLLCLPILLILLFTEGISLGFLIPLFISIYGLKGIFYFLVYFILIKFFYIFLITLLFIISIKFVKEYISYFRYKKITFLNYMFKYIFVVFMVLINDLFVYFIMNKMIIFLLG